MPDTGPWTYRALAGAPLAAALGAMLVATVGAQSQGALLATVSASKVLALFGCLLAALSFAPREAQFRGWALHALSYALLVQRDAILHRGLLGPIDAPHVAAIESALLVTANGAGLIGLGLLARAWRPLDDAPGAAARRTMVRVAAVVLALFIAAPSLWVNVEELLGGSLQAISGVATVLVDAAALAMLAPAALAVVGSRQESPGWAWALLTASLVGWLCFDAAVAIQAMTRPSDHAFGVTAEMFRVFSCVATCSAGIAQRLASRAA